MNYQLIKNILNIKNDNKEINIAFLKNQCLRIYESKVAQDLYEIYEKRDANDYLISNSEAGIKVLYDNTFHDRYIILDKEKVYHLGASINHAGSKTFSINVLEDEIVKKSLISSFFSTYI